MSLLPITALAGAVAGSAVVRSTADAARSLVEARPFAHLLSTGRETLAAGGEALGSLFSGEGEAIDGAAEDTGPLSELRSEAKAALALLASRLHERMEQFGLDASLPVDLEIPPGGEIEVTSTHPQREQVEQLLRQDQELAELAAYVGATQRHLHTSDTHSALLLEEAGHTFGSLERRAEELAGQQPERLVVRIDRGATEVEFR